ncbi:PH domain-containing protein [Thermopolyspora sp. NPDC052614]|uniref:PH domain-containing protein n=1 Tax=Thermopolyspora sp. NPDC052614 TaxID=3155682 RepID=UPI00341E59F0
MSPSPGRTAPPLPIVWLPRRTRSVAYAVAAVLVVGSVVFAVLLPARFHMPDRVGVVVFFCGVAWLLYMLGRSRVKADERGVTLVNAFRVRRYEWAELIGVSMQVGDPWPRLDLADGSSIGAMGIQGSEKQAADRAVAELRALIKEHGEAPEPGTSPGGEESTGA